MFKHQFIISLFSFIPLFVGAQLVTSTNQSPQQLVQNVLLGQGVDVFNITYSGASQAIGSFDAANTTLGFNSGVIITTGTANTINNGPQGPNNKPDASVNNGAGGYNRLTQLVGTQTYNAAVLEFDFIPYSDTVTFRYIFASEEYREFVKTQFNDVFGFFIAGPGIVGYKNIAILPNNTPVTINNINDGYISNGNYVPQCNNCSYFVYNGDGNNGPYNSQSKYIQYDGFTRPLKAVSPVQCGKTYHLIIAIADVNDAIYDSGIFLEANSLSSNIVAKVDYQLSFDAYGDNQTMAEGCADATVTVSRPADKAQNAMTIPITVAGSATEGVDYNNIPHSVTLNPGETIKTFTITPIQDFINEGIETIQLTFGIPNACGDIINTDIHLKIDDIKELQLSIDGADKLCPNQDVVLTALPIGGAGPYQYQWNTGETTSSITVSPANSQTYSVTVTESCANHTATASYTVNVKPYVPMTLFPSADISEPCRFKEHELHVDYINGAPDYQITWTNNAGENVGNDSSITVSPGETEVYHASILDGCGYTYDTLINYTITTPPLQVEEIPTVRICPGDSVVLTAQASGGYGTYHYDWSNGDTTINTLVHPNVSTTYIVSVSDQCQTYSEKTAAKVSVEIPTANFEVLNYPLTQNIPAMFHSTSTPNVVNYWWDFGDSLDKTISTLRDPLHTYEEAGGYIVKLIVQSDLGCYDSIRKAIEVYPEYYIYVPNSFTPNGDQNNQYFTVSTVNIIDFHLKIYNRWGELIFESYDKNFKWDGTYNGETVIPNDVYVWVIDYTPLGGKEKRITGHIAIIR